MQTLPVGDVAAGAARPVLDHPAAGGRLPERRRVVLVGGDREAGTRLHVGVMGDAQDDVELDGLRITRLRGQRREGRRVDRTARPQVDVRAHHGRQAWRVRARSRNGRARRRLGRGLHRLGDHRLGLDEEAVEHRGQLARIVRIRPAGVPGRPHRGAGELSGHAGDPLGRHPVVQEAPLAERPQQPLDLRRRDVGAGEPLPEHLANPDPWSDCRRGRTERAAPRRRASTAAGRTPAGRARRTRGSRRDRPGSRRRDGPVAAADRWCSARGGGGSLGRRAAQSLPSSAADTPTCTIRGWSMPATPTYLKIASSSSRG